MSKSIIVTTKGSVLYYFVDMKGNTLTWTNKESKAIRLDDQEVIFLMPYLAKRKVGYFIVDTP